MEHVEVDDRSVQNIYRPLVNSGLAFGAKRWVATLDRQCERLASSMASNIPAGDLCGTHTLILIIYFPLLTNGIYFPLYQLHGFPVLIILYIYSDN